MRVIAMRTRERERGKHLQLRGGPDWSVQTYLTNDTFSDPGEIACHDHGRAGIEPLIAEWKTPWGIGKFSCDGFLANAASRTLKLLSHHLVWRYVRERVPDAARLEDVVGPPHAVARS